MDLFTHLQSWVASVSGMVASRRSCWVTRNLHFSISCPFFSVVDVSLAGSSFVVAKVAP